MLLGPSPDKRIDWLDHLFYTLAFCISRTTDHRNYSGIWASSYTLSSSGETPSKPDFSCTWFSTIFFFFSFQLSIIWFQTPTLASVVTDSDPPRPIAALPKRPSTPKTIVCFSFFYAPQFKPLSFLLVDSERRVHLVVSRHSQDQHRLSPQTNLNNPHSVHQDPSGRRRRRLVLLKAKAQLVMIRMN